MFRILFFLLFLGSIFLTSEKFVDSENTAKTYFSILFLFVSIAIFALSGKNKKIEFKKLASLSNMKGIYFIGVIQAIYGILQYTGRFKSNHPNFIITGSFDNPAGFGAILALVVPIGVYWLIRSTKFEQKMVFFSVGIILFSIFLSGSRAAILTSIISSLIVLTIEFNWLSKLKKLAHRKIIVLSVVMLLFLGMLFLFKWRENSAKGRLLVWKVSLEMLKTKPALGFGFNGFQANYMEYQAKYFQENPQSKFSQLADNVKHPFNEFISVALSFGVVGLMLYLTLLFLIFWRVAKLKSKIQSIQISIFVGFIIISCFSYPLQYAPIWLLLGYFVVTVFFTNSPYLKLAIGYRLALASVCFVGVWFIGHKALNDMKWNSVAQKSLQGQTVKMLAEYDKLYPRMKSNPLFLYNYGAELNVAKRYIESIKVLKECQVNYNDYDLQMILADNYHNLGDSASALDKYELASYMIPCRFLPLYHQFNIYQQSGDSIKSKEIAQIIIQKEVKVESAIVGTIIQKAENYLSKGEPEDL